jgi:hypothetical protein
MRTNFTTVLIIAAGLFATGCAHRAERFALTARLLAAPLHSDSPRLVICLRNTSSQRQPVMMLTNVFEGYVYLGDRAGLGQLRAP